MKFFLIYVHSNLNQIILHEHLKSTIAFNFFIKKVHNWGDDQKQWPGGILKHPRRSLSLNKVAFGRQFIKKDTLTHVFSCEFCEIFKNIFFKRTFPVTSGPWQSWPRLTFNVLKITEMQPTASTSCHLKHLFPQISTGVLKQTIKTIKMFNWTNKKI